MGILDTLKKDTQEVENKVEENVKPQAPVQPVTSKKETKNPPTDHSVFNCQACNGEGLKNPYTVCSACGGTGKV